MGRETLTDYVYVSELYVLHVEVLHDVCMDNGQVRTICSWRAY